MPSRFVEVCEDLQPSVTAYPETSSAARARRRRTDAFRAAWPADAPGRVLVILIVLGVVLRVLACLSWWPTTILEDGYQTFANSNPFKDPLHPAGYSLLLGAFGAFTHQLSVLIIIQHLSGFASALLLWAAVNRLARASWTGLFPAAVILLSADQIYLEHSVMSECWEVLATSLGLYATVRLLDEPERWRVWGLVAGVALAASATLRSAASLIIPVAGLAVVLFRPTESSSWRTQWRAALALIASAAVVLVIFAGASASNGQGFRLAPSPGWYLYGRVAQFADCHRFTPPPGTAALCENTPLSQRRSAYFYMFDSHAPAQRLFGGFGRDDAVIGGWARRALSAQFGDFVSTAWTYLRSYYVPGSRPARLRSSTELDPQLDFSNQGNVFYDAAGHQALEDFFVPFSVHQQSWAQRVIRRWQVIFRFGATALFITTVLVLIGLIVGTRRSRIGVMLFGVGGLSLLLPPVLTSTYSGRYTVPLAAPLVAAAAITITQLWRMQRARARVNTAEGSAVRA